MTNSQWQPIAYAGSYGAQGYHVTFASGAIGSDVSGNGNNFTPVNLSNASVSSLSPGGSGAQVALTLDNGLPFNGGSSNQIKSATVVLTNGFANDGDLLSVNTSGTAITTSWNAANETLTLTGTDTAANYQAVLNRVMFSSSAADPTNGGANATRTATWRVTDTNNATSAPQSETIDISPAYAQSASPTHQATASASIPDIGLLTNYMASQFPSTMDSAHDSQLLSTQPTAPEGAGFFLGIPHSFGA